MQTIPTSPGRGPVWLALAASLVAVLMAMAAGCADVLPDPRLLYGAEQTAQTQEDVGLEPMQGDLPAARLPTAAPSPLVEVRSADTPRARPVQVAIGTVATRLGAPDPAALLTGFASECLTTYVTDRDAIELLTLGRTDFALIGQPLSQRDQHTGLCQTLLGAEVYALAVHPRMPLRSLGRDQVRRLLTGDLRDWSELGLVPGSIAVAVPADDDLLERAARALIPGDPIHKRAVRVDGERGVYDLLLREPGTIGLVRAATAALDPTVRLLAIDQIRPGIDTFRYGTYPYGTGLWLATPGLPRGAAEHCLATLQRDRRLDESVLSLPR